MTPEPAAAGDPAAPVPTRRRRHGGRLDGALALVQAELLIIRREWIAAASVILVAFVLGALPQVGQLVFAGRYGPALIEVDPDLQPPPIELGCSDVVVPIGIEGALAPDLAAAFDVVALDVATVAVRAVGSPPTLYEVTAFGFEDVPDARAVRGCLWEKMRERLDDRFDTLGVAERPGWVVRARFLYGGGSGLPELPFSAQGSAILSAAMLALLGVFTDVIPRARASGYLETLVVTPLRSWHLVGAWLVLGMIAVAFAAGAALLSYSALALLLGSGVGLEVPVVVIALAVPTLALVALTPYITLGDPRDAVLAGLPVAVGVAASIGVAGAIEALAPGLGGWLPVGGVLGALLGLVKLTGAGLAVAGATCSALFVNAVVRLASADPSSSSSDLGRRWAAGNHLPEVVLLFLLGMSGASAWVPAFLTAGSPVFGMAVGQALFTFLPAMVMTWPSQTSMKELLGLRMPSARGLVLSPLVALAAVAASLVLWSGGAWLLEVGALAHDIRTSAVAALGRPLAIVLMALIPAIGEELLFRGALLSLLRRGTSAGAAVVLQAAMFAVSQVLGFKLLSSFAIGLVLGILTIRTRSILPAIYVRMAVNVVALLMVGQLEYALDLMPAGVGLLLVTLAVTAPALAWWAGDRHEDE